MILFKPTFVCILCITIVIAPKIHRGVYGCNPPKIDPVLLITESLTRPPFWPAAIHGMIMARSSADGFASRIFGLKKNHHGIFSSLEAYPAHPKEEG